jgi:hypothetical protein
MTRQSSAGSLAQWYWAGAICGGLGVFEATQTVVAMRAAGMHHAWMALFIAVLLGWFPWVVAAPLVLRLARKYPLFTAPRWGRGCVMREHGWPSELGQRCGTRRSRTG